MHELANQSPPRGIAFEALPPERSAGHGHAAPAGYCCCCCCCLHTLGGFIGAVTAKPVERSGPELPAAAIAGRDLTPRYTAHRDYWLSVVVATLVAMLAFVPGLGWSPEALGWVVALAFPGIQLLAALIACCAMVASKRPGREQRFAHLGRIAGRAFVGGIIGMAVMVTLVIVLSAGL